MCLGLSFHTSIFSVAVMQTQEAGASLELPQWRTDQAGSRVDPEQVLGKDPAELRVWLGSLVLHAKALDLITSIAK